MKKENMKKIVITGGPCGGKTTVIAKIKKEFGKKIIVVPEVATALFENDYPVPNPWNQEWQDAFQTAIISEQLLAENRAEKEADKNGAKLIICDRGVLDGAAYLSGGVEEFCQKFKVDKAEALRRYAKVIHLENLASFNQGLYLTLVKTNPNRFESIKMAIQRELAIRTAWAEHPARISFTGELEKSEKMILREIKQYFKN